MVRQPAAAVRGNTATALLISALSIACSPKFPWNEDCVRQPYDLPGMREEAAETGREVGLYEWYATAELEVPDQLAGLELRLTWLNPHEPSVAAELESGNTSMKEGTQGSVEYWGIESMPHGLSLVEPIQWSGFCPDGNGGVRMKLLFTSPDGDVEVYGNSGSPTMERATATLSVRGKEGGITAFRE